MRTGIARQNISRIIKNGRAPSLKTALTTGSQEVASSILVSSTILKSCFPLEFERFPDLLILG
jgi:hypothetical protein